MKFFKFLSGSFFILFLEVFFLASCSEKSPSAFVEEKNSTEVSDTVRIPAVIPKELTLPEYQEWLTQQEGVTFDEQENEKLHLKILYKPLNFEAAISGGYTSEEELQKLIRIKEGFHYFKVECFDKNRSVNKPTDKEELFSQLKENLLIIKNQQDTIQNAILEVFTAPLMNQPHQLLVMVPADDSITHLQAIIRGKPFGLKDLKISVSQTQIKSFPEIKL